MLWPGASAAKVRVTQALKGVFYAGRLTFAACKRASTGERDDDAVCASHGSCASRAGSCALAGCCRAVDRGLAQLACLLVKQLGERGCFILGRQGGAPIERSAAVPALYILLRACVRHIALQQARLLEAVAGCIREKARLRTCGKLATRSCCSRVSSADSFGCALGPIALMLLRVLCGPCSMRVGWRMPHLTTAKRFSAAMTSRHLRCSPSSLCCTRVVPERV